MIEPIDIEAVRAERRRRARIEGGSLWYDISKRDRIMARDGRRCVWCGKRRRLTVDHIVPRSRGGSNCDINLRVLCAPCNTMKGDRLDIEIPGLIAERRALRR